MWRIKEWLDRIDFGIKWYLVFCIVLGVVFSMDKSFNQEQIVTSLKTWMEAK